MCDEQQTLAGMAKAQGIRVGVIYSDTGYPAVLLEVMDDDQDAEREAKALAAGHVQTQIARRV